MSKVRFIVATAAILATASFGTPCKVAKGADHLDSPRVTTNGRLDINDVYLFRQPNANGRVVIAFTVAPNAGILSPTTFQAGAFYELQIDTNGDAIEDAMIRTTFSQPNRNGVQTVRFQFSKGASAFDLGTGLTNTNMNFQVGTNQVRARAGLFDDPFFFDLDAFNKFKVSGDPGEFGRNPVNFFKTFNTLAIVLELPTSLFLPAGDNTFGVYARTVVGLTQFDRMGIPAVNTVFIQTSAQKDSFNSGIPRNDRRDFRAIAIDTLVKFPYFQPLDRSTAIADFVLPDYLPIDVSQTGGFPNGRQLPNDVIDIELNLVSNGGIPTDFINNDSTFLPNFPYLGVPQVNEVE